MEHAFEVKAKFNYPRLRSAALATYDFLNETFTGHGVVDADTVEGLRRLAVASTVGQFCAARNVAPKDVRYEVTDFHHEPNQLAA